MANKVVFPLGFGSLDKILTLVFQMSYATILTILTFMKKVYPQMPYAQRVAAQATYGRGVKLNI